MLTYWWHKMKRQWTKVVWVHPLGSMNISAKCKHWSTRGTKWKFRGRSLILWQIDSSCIDQHVFMQQWMLNHFCATATERKTYIPMKISGIMTLIQTGLNLRGGSLPSEQHVQSILRKSTTCKSRTHSCPRMGKLSQIRKKENVSFLLCSQTSSALWRFFFGCVEIFFIIFWARRRGSRISKVIVSCLRMDREFSSVNH